MRRWVTASLVLALCVSAAISAAMAAPRCKKLSPVSRGYLVEAVLDDLRQSPDSRANIDSALRRLTRSSDQDLIEEAIAAIESIHVRETADKILSATDMPGISRPLLGTEPLASVPILVAEGGYPILSLKPVRETRPAGWRSSP